MIPTRLPIVPDATRTASSVPSSSAARSSSARTVGSSPNTSSPTSAAAIAARIAGEGWVTVSERRSIIGPQYGTTATTPPESTVAYTPGVSARVGDGLSEVGPGVPPEVTSGLPPPRPSGLVGRSDIGGRRAARHPQTAATLAFLGGTNVQILVVTPHTDDFIYGLGGTLLTHEDDEIHIVAVSSVQQSAARDVAAAFGATIEFLDAP